MPSTCYVNYNHNHFKNKCAQYWPDINDKLQGGMLTVRHLEEKSYAEYIIRRFKMHNKTVNNYIKNYKAIFTYRVWFRSFCISKTCLLMCICLNNLISLIKFNCCKVKNITKNDISLSNEYIWPWITNLSQKYCLNSLTFFKFVTSFQITTILLTCDKSNVSQQIKYLGQHSFTVFICSVELCHLKLFIVF